jgi:hypothetical protein
MSETSMGAALYKNIATSPGSSFKASSIKSFGKSVWNC